MSNTINVAFIPTWTTPGERYAALDFEMINRSGAPLVNPQIKIQLAQSATATPGSNHTFTQSGNTLTGTLASWVTG
ncbi:MAG: hypothetical protein WDN30_09980 [Pararobbsia sp.]